MNKMKYIRLFTVFLIVIPSIAGFAQTKPTVWTLQACIDYARQNNIQVRSSRIASQTGLVDIKEARSQLFPSLIFSSSQDWVHQKTEQENGNFKSQNTYTGSYSLNSGITLYNGGKLTKSVRLQEISARALKYDTEVSENDIEIAVTEIYLQILYANEALKTNLQTLETSKAQLDRSKELYEAGSIAVSDYAQIKAQYSNDRYQVTVAENTLALTRLELKQLLELGLNEPFEVFFPEIDTSKVLVPVPTVAEVYHTALEVMPEVKSNRLSTEAALLQEKIAASDRLPNLSLSVSVNTNHDSQSDYSFSKQINNRFSENIGINISIPISKNRQVKSAVERARLQTESTKLEERNTEKTLLKTIETLHQEVLSAQSRYLAASNSLKSATLSYRLVQEQFNAGMKNTVELLTEKNNYLSALQEQTQAKYQAVLAIRLLNFYQNEPIGI